MSRDEEFAAWAAAATPALLRTGDLLTGDRPAAEDLVQDVLERVYVRWSRVEDPGGYAHRALVNAATSRWRRRRRRPEVSWDAVAEPAAPRRQQALVEDRSDLVAVLAHLPVQQRAVLVLRYLQDRPEQEVADLLGISAGTVKSHTSRGLARLRRLLPCLDEPAGSAPTRGGREDGAR